MKELETTDFTFEQAIEEYKKYNNELSNIITSIKRISENDEISENDYKAFAEFRSFSMLYIMTGNLDEVHHSIISDAVANVFIENVNSLQSLNIGDKGSATYRSLMKLIVESNFQQSDMLNGLHRVIDFINSVDELPEYYEDTFVFESEEILYPTIKDRFLNTSRFYERASLCKNDMERVELIRKEIRSVKLNCIGEYKLYSRESAKEYTDELEEIMNIYMQYGDDSTKIFSNDVSQSTSTAAPDAIEHEEEEQDDKSESNKNKATVFRKCIALYYLFNEISPDLFNEGNVKPLARFVKLLTGNNEKNIYDYLRNMHDMLDKETPKVKSDINFVITELEKINLGEVSDKIRRDTKG